ncbi:hypothetical protein J7E29_02465 [Streptomyces sp. ISL-90]|nr:hypothetical protein [Streptomyces sp. ISL-90]
MGEGMRPIMPEEREAFMDRVYPGVSIDERAELRLNEWLGEWELDAAIRCGF